MSPQKRIVLLPFGHADHASIEAREACNALLVHCGGDVCRVFDRPTIVDSYEHYVRFIGRMEDVRVGANPPIVALTNANSLSLNVINTRRRLTRVYPAMLRALWIIFFDPVATPFFVKEASDLGTFDGALDAAPLWNDATTDDTYLILTPQMQDLVQLEWQLGRYEAALGTSPKRKTTNEITVSGIRDKLNAPSSKKS